VCNARRWSRWGVFFLFHFRFTCCDDITCSSDCFQVSTNLTLFLFVHTIWNYSYLRAIRVLKKSMSSVCHKIVSKNIRGVSQNWSTVNQSANNNMISTRCFLSARKGCDREQNVNHPLSIQCSSQSPVSSWSRDFKVRYLPDHDQFKLKVTFYLLNTQKLKNSHIYYEARSVGVLPTQPASLPVSIRSTFHFAYHFAYLGPGRQKVTN
jgi:hypothetical protein